MIVQSRATRLSPRGARTEMRWLCIMLLSRILGADMLGSVRGHMKLTDHCPDITILEDPAFALRCFLDDNVHHGTRQVVGLNHLVGEEQPKRGVDRAQETIVEIRLLPWPHGIDVCGPKDVHPREPCSEERLLCLSLMACEGHPTSASRVRALTAQKLECRLRAASTENSRELDGVSHGDCAELSIRHRSGICAQTKDCRVLTEKRLRECRAVREVLVKNLFQLGVRDAEVLASDRRHSFD